MNFYITDEMSLTAISPVDAPLLRRWLSSGIVQKTIHDIPHPYELQEAESFIESADERCHKFGRLMDWAIRSSESGLIGMISFKGTANFSKGTDEIGFWLAEPYWGRGIMTGVLNAFIRLSFDVFRLQSLEAVIFESNKASQSVVRKCGFVQSEHLTDFVSKGSCRINVLRFIRFKNP